MIELLEKLEKCDAGTLQNIIQAAAEMAPDHPEWTLQDAIQAGYDELTYEPTDEETGDSVNA